MYARLVPAPSLWPVFSGQTSHCSLCWETSLLWSCRSSPAHFSVQFSRSVVFCLFATPWTVACQASLSITNFQSLLKLMSIMLVMPSNHLILCHPLLLLPSIFPSIRVFSSESALRIRWPNYWSFSFSISPPSEYSGLISFRMDWLDLLAVQGPLKSLLQHHRSKASILRCSAFFMIRLSLPNMTIGKTIALTRWAFVGRVMSLLFILSIMASISGLIWEEWYLDGLSWAFSCPVGVSSRPLAARFPTKAHHWAFLARCLGTCFPDTPPGSWGLLVGPAFAGICVSTRV